MRKIIIAGQISLIFGAIILSIRHFFLIPAHSYSIVLTALIIGFIPSIIFMYISLQKKLPYIIVSNALLVVSIVYYYMGESTLSGIFMLVPVFSLLFKNKNLYFFSAFSSIVVFLLITFPRENAPTDQLIMIINYLTESIS